MLNKTKKHVHIHIFFYNFYFNHKHLHIHGIADNVGVQVYACNALVRFHMSISSNVYCFLVVQYSKLSFKSLFKKKSVKYITVICRISPVNGETLRTNSTAVTH